jgi:hypothetical protein
MAGPFRNATQHWSSRVALVVSIYITSIQNNKEVALRSLYPRSLHRLYKLMRIDIMDEFFMHGLVLSPFLFPLS